MAICFREQNKLSDEGLRAKLEQYKPFQSQRGQTHDLLCIEEIQGLRPAMPRSIEDASAIFLTADLKLCRFNFYEMEHRADGTICEVITDRLLANILWLKTPKTGLPLPAIISAHSRDLFINRSIWDRFYYVLQGLHRTKQVDDGKVSMLFYHNYIEGQLQPLEDSDVEKITPSFVLGLVQEQSETIDYRITKSLQDMQQEFLANLDEGVEAAQAAKNDNWLSRIEVQKEKVRTSAEQAAKRYLLWSQAILGCVLMIWLAIEVYRNHWEVIGRADSLLAIFILALLPVSWILKGVRMKFLQWLSNSIYERRIKHGGLEDLTQEDS